MADFATPTKNKLLPLTALAPMDAQPIRDISPSYWFGPLQPVKTVAPSSFRPRQYGYTPGANILWQPKGDDPISYDVLRELADAWDILRIAITTQLDRICSCEWDIRVKPAPGELKAEFDKRNEEDEAHCPGVEDVVVDREVRLLEAVEAHRLELPARLQAAADRAR